MVEAVDLDLVDAERGVQAAPRLDRDRVARVRRHLVGALERRALHLLPCLPAAVGGVLGPLRLDRDVLDERAAEGDVQDLDAAAHPEDGEPAVEHAFGQLELEGVPNRLRRRQMLRGLLPVASRVDVAAAAEEDAVADVERVLDVAVDAREREPDPADERERPLEADPGVVAEVVQAEREADHRFARGRHDWTFLSQSS